MYALGVISVLVADDHSIVREGIRHVLEGENDIKVCAEAADGEEVLEQVERHRPDLVILDITMPRLSGLETLERIRSKHPGLKTVLISFRADPPIIQSAACSVVFMAAVVIAAPCLASPIVLPCRSC